ncbi:MAG TPA: RhuM family protein [Flavobacteriales bacterium]|nr:RhuM family protein [Flavobacteriales bacterium]
MRKVRITAGDGKSYLTNHYNFDAIIAVGHRVNSQCATGFRILNCPEIPDSWAQGRPDELFEDLEWLGAPVPGLAVGFSLQDLA